MLPSILYGYEIVKTAELLKTLAYSCDSNWTKFQTTECLQQALGFYSRRKVLGEGAQGEQ